MNNPHLLRLNPVFFRNTYVSNLMYSSVFDFLACLGSIDIAIITYLPPETQSIGSDLKKRFAIFKGEGAVTQDDKLPSCSLLLAK